MLYLRRARFFRSLLLPLTLVAFLPACHKWVPIEPPYAPAIETDRPDSVRLTVDGERFIVHEPVVMKDSLVGQRNMAARIQGEPVLSKFALGDIQSVEENRPDEAGTVGAVIGGLVVGGGLILLVALSQRDLFGGCCR